MPYVQGLWATCFHTCSPFSDCFYQGKSAKSFRDRCNHQSAESARDRWLSALILWWLKWLTSAKLPAMHYSTSPSLLFGPAFSGISGALVTLGWHLWGFCFGFWAAGLRVWHAGLGPRLSLCTWQNRTPYLVVLPAAFKGWGWLPLLHLHPRKHQQADPQQVGKFC